MVVFVRISAKNISVLRLIMNNNNVLKTWCNNLSGYFASGCQQQMLCSSNPSDVIWFWISSEQARGIIISAQWSVTDEPIWIQIHMQKPWVESTHWLRWREEMKTWRYLYLHAQSGSERIRVLEDIFYYDDSACHRFRYCLVVITLYHVQPKYNKRTCL